MLADMPSPQHFSKPVPELSLFQVQLPIISHKYFQDTQSNKEPLEMSQNIEKEARWLKLSLHTFLPPGRLWIKGTIFICETISHTNKLISSIMVKWGEIEYFFILKVNSRPPGKRWRNEILTSKGHLSSSKDIVTHNAAKWKVEDPCSAYISKCFSTRNSHWFRLLKSANE